MFFPSSLADGEGLEPPDVSRRQRFSKPQHLAILPPILKKSHITSGECRVRNFPLPNNRLYLPISRHSQKQQSSLSTTAQRSSRLCIPGSPGFFGWCMACRSNRSIPAHSIPVTFAHRNMSSHSPRSLPLRAFPLPEACSLPCSVLFGASSFQFQPRRASPRRFWSSPVVVKICSHIRELWSRFFSHI